MPELLATVVRPLLAARKASLMPFDVVLAFWILFGVVFLACIVYAIFKSMSDRRKDAAANDEFQKWQSEVAAAGYLPELRLPIKLQKGETGYFQAAPVTLCEPRAIRTGGYGGGSVRIAKGISIHTGRFSSESHDEWRAITTGSLYVTDKRIIFDGDTKNRVINLEDVMSIVPGYREVCVNSSKLQKPIGFQDVNGQIFAAVIDTLSGSEE